MVSRHRRLLVHLVAVAIATAPTSALAQPTPPAAPAAPVPPPAPGSDKVELNAAGAAARSKDWAGALTHYQAAMQVVPSLRAQLGTGDSLYQLGRLGESYEAYQAVQRDYATKLAPAEKALVAARLKEMATKTGWLSVRVSEAGAQVDLDGKAMGTSPLPALVRVAVGSHEVHATKDGFAPFTARAEVVADGQAAVEAVLAAEVTQAHIAVHTTGEPLRVLVDGVDVGATPWEGSVSPGPHEMSGRSSTATAIPQQISVKAGDHLGIDLVAAATAAHLQIRSSDGKGVIFVDGVMRAEGAFATEVSPGPHNVIVTREGYERFDKTSTLAPRDTWAETVTLKQVAATGGEVEAAERPIEGTYGSFGLTGLFGVGGQGTELETNCDTLGAMSCETPSPIGGGLFGYFGYTWNPVGFELFVAASADAVQQKAHFDGKGKTGALPFAIPARDESFTFLRVGGVAALRVRATFQTRRIRGTFAAGPGFSYKEMIMKRDATATDGTARQNSYVPGPVGYASPAVSVEGAIHLRASGAFAVSLGLLVLVDNASSSTAAASSTNQKLAAQNQFPAPIATPGYHLASGPQVFLGPFIGLAFGP